MGICFCRGPTFGEHGGTPILRDFEIKRYVKCPVSRHLSPYGPHREPGGDSLTRTFERKGKYILVPFLDTEDTKILSLGAIWNFGTRTRFL